MLVVVTIWGLLLGSGIGSAGLGPVVPIASEAILGPEAVDVIGRAPGGFVESPDSCESPPVAGVGGGGPAGGNSRQSSPPSANRGRNRVVALGIGAVSPSELSVDELGQAGATLAFAFARPRELRERAAPLGGMESRGARRS